MGAFSFLCRFGSSTEGSPAVELAVIAPILLTLLAGLLDFGNAVYTKMLVDDAAQSAAAYVALNSSSQALYKSASSYSEGQTAVYSNGSTSAAGMIWVYTNGTSSSGNAPAATSSYWAAGPCSGGVSSSTSNYNAGCPWNEAVAAAAQQAHAYSAANNTTIGTLDFASSSCTASFMIHCAYVAANVAYCPISSNAVSATCLLPGSSSTASTTEGTAAAGSGYCTGANCSTPPGASSTTVSPACIGPGANTGSCPSGLSGYGVYEEITVYSTFNTIFPWNNVLSEFSIAPPSSFETTYWARIE